MRDFRVAVNTKHKREFMHNVLVALGAGLSSATTLQSVLDNDNIKVMGLRDNHLLWDCVVDPREHPGPFYYHINHINFDSFSAMILYMKGFGVCLINGASRVAVTGDMTLSAFHPTAQFCLAYKKPITVTVDGKVLTKEQALEYINSIPQTDDSNE